MLIREIEGATRHLGAPADWDQSKGRCDVLPIADVMTDQGPFMVSAWAPTAEELAALNAGASVRLWIQGESHPVVVLDVDGARERSRVDLDALEAAARAATPQNIDSAEIIQHGIGSGEYLECPHCAGDGSVPLEADYCNYDGEPLGVQFYGIGAAPGAAEAYFRAAKPATVLSLIADVRAADEVIDLVAAKVGGLFACMSHGLQASPTMIREARDAANRALEFSAARIEGNRTPIAGNQNQE